MKATEEQWKKLYEAAVSFKQAEVWNWMDNIHLFGVKHPDSNQTGYCCIMGGGGEMYGIAVYLGTEGLMTVIDMFNEKLTEDLQFAQHCLMLSYDDREDLHPQERAQIKELGFKFRGRQAWPTFRLYEPGYYPWPISEASDVSFLTAAIEQAKEVAFMYKKNPDELRDPSGKFLTRVAERLPDGSLSWRSEWLEPEFDESGAMEIRQQEPLNELRLAKIKKSAKKQRGAWELGTFYLPNPVLEGERPFYPVVFLVLDQESGQILTCDLCKKTEIATVAPVKLLELIEKFKVMPSELRASDSRIFDDLGPVIAALELQENCYLYPKLSMLEEARDGMIEMMT